MSWKSEKCIRTTFVFQLLFPPPQIGDAKRQLENPPFTNVECIH
ncbi:MAG: hypothetical protein ACTSYB_09125 [Candidatus Helarchaeota archaeon]